MRWTPSPLPWSFHLAAVVSLSLSLSLGISHLRHPVQPLPLHEEGLAILDNDFQAVTRTLSSAGGV